MAVLSPQRADISGGTVVVFDAADSAGDELPIGHRRILCIQVDSSASSDRTVTVTTHASVDGVAVEDVSATVSPGTIHALTVSDIFRNPDTRRALVSYDDETNVSVALLETDKW